MFHLGIRMNSRVFWTIFLVTSVSQLSLVTRKLWLPSSFLVGQGTSLDVQRWEGLACWALVISSRHLTAFYEQGTGGRVFYLMQFIWIGSRFMCVKPGSTLGRLITHPPTFSVFPSCNCWSWACSPDKVRPFFHLCLFLLPWQGSHMDACLGGGAHGIHVTVVVLITAKVLQTHFAILYLSVYTFTIPCKSFSASDCEEFTLFPCQSCSYTRVPLYTPVFSPYLHFPYFLIHPQGHTELGLSPSLPPWRCSSLVLESLCYVNLGLL